MGRGLQKGSQMAYKTFKSEKKTIEDSMISLLSHLSTLLTTNSPQDSQLRLLHKFLENQLEKIDRLVEIFVVTDKRLEMFDQRLILEKQQKLRQQQQQDDDEDEDDMYVFLFIYLFIVVLCSSCC